MRRTLGFIIAPLLSALSPLLVLPVIAGSTNESGWAAIAIGQSIGAFLSVTVAFGWPVNGSVRAARATPEELEVIYYESLKVRLFLFAIALFWAVGAAWATAPDGWQWFAAAMAFVSVLPGLSASWLAIGLGKPYWIVYFETIPRVVLAIAAAVLIGQGYSLWLFPAFLALGSVAGLIYFSVAIMRPSLPDDSERRSIRSIMQEQGSAATTTIVGAVYSVGSIFLASAVTTPSEIANLSSADRIYRLTTLAITISTSALLPWVLAANPDGRRRDRTAIFLVGGIGVLGIPALALGVPPLARAFFGEAFAPSRSTSLAYGVAFFGVALATTLGHHFLIPNGHIRAFMSGSFAAAIVGTPSTLFLASAHGATGAASGLAVSEIVLVAVLVGSIGRRKIRARSKPSLASSIFPTREASRDLDGL